MAKKTSYKDMSVEDLKNRAIELGSELVAARQKARLGQFKKTSDFSRIRKDIARAKTFIRQQELKATKA